MIIKCKKTKRFLMNINIEEYLENLEKVGVSQEIPLQIIIPCRLCKKKELYYVYKNRYDFVKNIDKKS